jgi:hypothetical protein
MGSPPTNYSLIDQCQEFCLKDCLRIKEIAPFNAVLTCSTQRCNCWLDLTKTVQEQLNVTSAVNTPGVIPQADVV